MKILNLYTGLGGNRKKWQGHEVTAVELNPTIAKFYNDHYPNDKVIIADAHEYLLNNYKEFDFIWSSVNCPSHSRARFWAAKGGKYKPVFPDLKLYEEILFLQNYFGGGFVVENVVPYYEPLIKPTFKTERHLFWVNFKISHYQVESNYIFSGDDMKRVSKMMGIDITGYDFDIRKDKLLRNCVHPDLGLHILNCYEGIETNKKTSQFELNFNL
jgi:DNA (cytosine-5)-methyltransferase 1